MYVVQCKKKYILKNELTHRHHIIVSLYSKFVCVRYHDLIFNVLPFLLDLAFRTIRKCFSRIGSNLIDVDDLGDTSINLDIFWQ